MVSRRTLRGFQSTRISVIESRWQKDANTSVRSLFDLLADIRCANPHAYHYEMAGSELAAKEAICRIARDGRTKILCIATHGDRTGNLHLHNGDKLSRAELRNCLLKVDGRNHLEGLYLSSCGVGTYELATFLFRRETTIRWVAGYTEYVDWLDSSALDMLFFNEWLNWTLFAKGFGVNNVADRLRKRAMGLVAELGFSIYVRKQGAGGGEVKNLLSDCYNSIGS